MGHEAPQTLCDRAANAAIHAAEAVLEEDGARLETIFVTLWAEDVPEGEPNAVSAGGGDSLSFDLAERSSQILSFLVGAAVRVGEQLGVTIHVAPIGRG